MKLESGKLILNTSNYANVDLPADSFPTTKVIGVEC
jgi:hypothetical protein